MSHKNHRWLTVMTHSKYLQSANVILTSFLWFSLYNLLHFQYLVRSQWVICFSRVLIGQFIPFSAGFIQRSKSKNFREKYFRNVFSPWKRIWKWLKPTRERNFHRRGKGYFYQGVPDKFYKILKLWKFLLMKSY